jgi:hypothetical protein
MCQSHPSEWALRLALVLQFALAKLQHLLWKNTPTSLAIQDLAKMVLARLVLGPPWAQGLL